MKYAITKTVNGNYSIDSEAYITIPSALVNYHNLASALWNASDVTTACIALVDENLNVVQGYREFISHPAPNAE